MKTKKYRKIRRFERGYKPSLLTKIILVICIITYSILIGLNTFTGLFNTYAQELINSSYLPSFMYFYRLKILDIISYSPYFFIVVATIQIFILLSFITLYKGFTTGYYSFIIAQTCALVFPLLVMGKKAIAIGDIMIAAFLIVYLFIELILHQVKPTKEEIIS